MVEKNTIIAFLCSNLQYFPQLLHNFPQFYIIVKSQEISNFQKEIGGNFQNWARKAEKFAKFPQKKREIWHFSKFDKSLHSIYSKDQSPGSSYFCDDKLIRTEGCMIEKKINLCNDILFKAVFQSEEARNVMITFLNHITLIPRVYS